MRTLLAALTVTFLSFTSQSHADLKIDSVGVGHWLDENPYIEIYQETEIGLHPQIFLGTDVVGASVKTDPLYEKYGVGIAPYFGLGSADSDMTGLMGVEIDRSFKVMNKRLDAYFRLNIDFDDSDMMFGARYFFDSK